MADAKISQLPVATTPLDGTELVAVVQSSTTKQATVNNILTAGLPVSASTLAASGNVTLGDASTDTVQVNGVMGVGGTNSFPAQYGAHIKNSALTGTNIYGAVSEVTGPATATVSINAFTSVPTTSANTFTVATVRGFQAANAAKGAGSTITNLHGVWVADQTQGTNNYGITSLVSSGTNKWNIYASGTAANYFAGNVGIGDLAVAYKLVVKDAAESNATAFKPFVNLLGSYGSSNSNHGLGFSINTNPPSAGIYVSELGGAGSNLIFTNSVSYTTATQLERFKLGVTEAVFNDPGDDYDFRVESDTNTHAFFVQGSDGNVGIGTSSPANPLHVVGTSAAQFQRTSAGTVSMLLTPTGANTQWSLGAHSDGYFRITNEGVSERLRINSSGNVSIGGTADRATTVGSAALNIFNGTAPVGTLTNGISIYSSSGEAYVMDAAGNATLFSPHDAETNEWIFKSKHTPTGKVLKIDVERLLRFVNDHFGLDAVQEFIED